MYPKNLKRADSIINHMNIVLQLFQHDVILAKGETTTGYTVAIILNNCPIQESKCFIQTKLILDKTNLYVTSS